MFKLKTRIETHGITKINILFYFIAFIIGGVFGITCLDVYKETLVESIYYFSSYMKENETLEIGFFISSIWRDVKNIALLYLISLTTYYIPITMCFVAYHGICMGFLIMALMRVYGWNGFLLSLIYFFPQGICLAASYLLIIKFSYQNYISNRKYEKKKKQNKQLKLLMLICFLIILSRVLEIFINYPLLHQWFLG